MELISGLSCDFGLWACIWWDFASGNNLGPRLRCLSSERLWVCSVIFLVRPNQEYINLLAWTIGDQMDRIHSEILRPKLTNSQERTFPFSELGQIDMFPCRHYLLVVDYLISPFTEGTSCLGSWLNMVVLISMLQHLWAKAVLHRGSLTLRPSWVASSAIHIKDACDILSVIFKSCWK